MCDIIINLESPAVVGSPERHG